MRKIGPIVSIVAGTFTTIFAILGILVIYGQMDGNGFVGNYIKTIKDNDVSIKTILFIHLGLGLVQILLGIFSIKKARGISSIILLIVFAVSFGLILYSSIHNDEWPTTSIINLVIYGIASSGLIYGLFKGNK
ncbi:MAG: hypothetical protein K4H23_02305 [Mollicutes bacterium PWAP]|nr:hypothetical protein [Mollicutes bacterium PWAP]